MSVFFERQLPHYHAQNATYFITFRLAESLPIEAWKKMREEYEMEKRLLANQFNGQALFEERYKSQKRHFGRFDKLLDTAREGPRWLADPQIADIVAKQIYALHREEYYLHAYCIMPNHVHLLIDQQDIPEPPRPINGKHYTALSRAMRSLKGISGYYCLQALERKGKFWQHESFDHIVRNEKEFERILNYIANNPVKAGLVKQWDEWKHTYINVG